MNESCLTRHKKTIPLYAPRSTLTERGTRGVLDEALPTMIRRMQKVFVRRALTTMVHLSSLWRQGISPMQTTKASAPRQ